MQPNTFVSLVPRDLVLSATFRGSPGTRPIRKGREIVWPIPTPRLCKLQHRPNRQSIEFLLILFFIYFNIWKVTFVQTTAKLFNSDTTSGLSRP